MVRLDEFEKLVDGLSHELKTDDAKSALNGLRDAMIARSEAIIVYSQPSSFRVRNLKRNPQVALNFRTDPHGNKVTVILGVAALKPGNQIIPAGYWAKYEKLLPGIDQTVEGMIRDYSVEIRVKPTRARGE
jgi:PPOX class probable F420-dependent enzyme